jgi:hypothetical protein
MADPERVRIENGHVIQFPLDRRAAAVEAQRQWEFSAAVHDVRGVDADWVAVELAEVLRDLLAWAHEDCQPGDAEERAA